MAASPTQAASSSLPQTSGDETSPFSMLKGRYSDDQQGFILRTRSLDEGGSLDHGRGEHHHGEHADDQEEAASASAAALHSSFDVAMLQDRSGSPYFSEDEQDEKDRSGENNWSENGEFGELSGKKHLRPKAPLETVEANPPGTVRKHPRRTAVPSVVSNKTPARPRLRPPGAMKKGASTTPSSAAKRRRAHWQVGQSPVSRIMPPTTPFQAPSITSPPSSTVKLDASIFGTGLLSGSNTFSPSPPAAQTPNRQTTGPFGTGTANKSMSKWHNTGTTAASSTLLETTMESSSSVDTSSPTTTRFRFTSFPASLPRVNNLRSREFCPESLRKRIPFAEPLGSSNHDANNQSRDDDAGTQNTSISSLSGCAEGHHQHLAPAPGACLPPTILDLHPPSPPAVEEQEQDHDDSNNTNTRPIHAKLFAEDEVFGYSDDDDDDDDTESSAVGGIVGRTRLNFANALSPHNNNDVSKAAKGAELDLTKAYDQRRINSFQSSSLSSHTHMNNLSGCEVGVGESLTPARPSADQYSHSRRELTPREVQLHFPLEEDYSPIPGFKEDSGRCEIMHDPLPSSSEHSSILGGQGLLPRQLQEKTDTTVSSVKCSTDQHMKEESSSTGSMSGGSANGKSRRLRPMPDMSAFESGGHAMVSSTSRCGERSSDDSATLDSAQRLKPCPPTPVRTPAWANEGGALARYGRQSSLITTKVLLSVPSQVVEGRCSMENSVLDDDSSRFSNKHQSMQKEDGPGGTNKGDKINVAALLPPGLGIGSQGEPASASKIPKLHAPPRLMRRVPPGQEVDSVISFSNDFEILRALGSGAFADVYKVRSVRDNRLYAVKRNRRQFRGKRDREMALAEVQAMQRLESVYAEAGSNSPHSAEKSSYCLYLLFFYRAWQEDGYFFCQTELCCRDTCRELLDSSRFLWNSAKNRYPSLRRHLQSPGEASSPKEDDAAMRLIPNDTVWKICHDIAAGLSHIHSHGMVHHDIKPSNIFFVAHPRFGAMCKIGDFGMAGEIGSSADGLEGDTRYMPPELLAMGARHPSADIFSLGLTIYEIATDQMAEMPSEGPQWHFLRSANGPTLPNERGDELLNLVKAMTDPNEAKRPAADTILTSQKVIQVGHRCDQFLKDYIHDIESFDQMEEERLAAMESHEDQTPRNGSHRSVMPVRSPSLSMLMSNPPNLLSPVAKFIN